MTIRHIIVAAPIFLASYVVVMAGGQAPPARSCRIEGRITSGTTPLPGVSIGVRTGDTSRLLTSTELDGRFTLSVTPGATYVLYTDFSGFAPVERSVTVGESPCNTTLDLQLTLGGPAAAAPAPAQSVAERLAQLRARASAARGRGNPEPSTLNPNSAPGTLNPAPGRFQTLSVQGNADAEPALAAGIDANEVAQFLPPGFSIESAQGDAIAMNGGGNATNINRGALNERLRAIDAGEFDPSTGIFAAGFGPFGGAGFPGGPGGPGGFGGPGGPGGRGGGPGFGPGDVAAFVLGGRGGRGQSPYQGFATYSFGGSALNSAPYQLRSDVPVTQPQFAQNTFGGTFGGPLRIPGVYADTNRRTNFQINYNGNESNNLFDQYATVPTVAMRSGDFSSVATQLVDPKTGQMLAGNQIQPSQIDPTAAALLGYIPAPNLPGDTRNYHVSTTAHSSSNSVSLRLTQNLSPTAPSAGPGGRGGRGAGGAGGGGFGGGRGGGRGGRGGPGLGRTNIILNTQLQYRENASEGLNVFPGLGSETTNRSVTVPVMLNVAKNRTIQNLGVTFTHSSVETTNAFANTTNAAGQAGIQYPAGMTIDPINWGVPNLSFSGFTGLRAASASERGDDRWSANYMFMRPLGRHRPRIGADVRYDRSESLINSNARGSFVFNGSYSANGAVGVTGADFADFLLGAPRQASLQVGGMTTLRQYSVNAFVEDDWQANAKLSFNLGLRYELARPYVEINGRMANLDANADLSSVAAVLPGGMGPYTGAFPASLLNTDVNNLGPRLGIAYRVNPSTILRGGYSVTYNSGSYASIARELAGQPPFAETDTITGTSAAPLTIAEALIAPTPTTTNNWGVDRDYALGTIQTWNATVSKNLTQDWTVQAGYTGVKGTNLDLLRAPALGAGGALIPGTQAFIWESSGGRSMMHGANAQIRRRLAGGITGGFAYTFAHSMDNASSLGAGGAVVAQNDRDLEAEYARSTLERRHQVSANLFVELPWGPNRRWLKDGGVLAGLFGEWSAQFNLNLQSGTPLTARVVGSTSDLTRGVNGSLRADYNGQDIVLSNPTVDEFFNTAAFSLPVGTFGTSSRNLITGPGQHQLNGLFQRDIRVGGNRSVTLQVNAQNLLNTVQWAGIDTNVNSPTFGQVMSVRPMRTITVTARMRF